MMWYDKHLGGLGGVPPRVLQFFCLPSQTLCRRRDGWPRPSTYLSIKRRTTFAYTWSRWCSTSRATTSTRLGQISEMVPDAPSSSSCGRTRAMTNPLPREVFAADFRDRVVHHLLVSHQERIFEPLFIHDSYACRTGKGTLAASDRLMTFLRQATANGRRPAWALKLDVASFFPSIGFAQKPLVFHTLLCNKPFCTKSRINPRFVNRLNNHAQIMI